MSGLAIELWVVMALFTLIVDVVMIYRRMSGKLGEQARKRYAMTASRLGGLRVLLIVTGVLDLVAWPFSLAACAFGYLNDTRSHRAELASQCSAGPSENR